MLGNVHRYTVQCALPVNLYNEMVFTFLWFWFVLLAACSISSFLMWTWRAFYRPRQIRYIKSHLIVMEKLRLDEVTDVKVDDFVDWLRRDGIFIVHLVSKNTSGIIAAELTCALWECFKKHKKEKRKRGIRGVNFINLVQIHDISQDEDPIDMMANNTSMDILDMPRDEHTC